MEIFICCFASSPLGASSRQNTKLTKDAGAVEEKTCASHFHADVESPVQHSKKYDLHGIGGLACRHGILMAMMNCIKGEQYAYAIMMLAMLLRLPVAVRSPPCTLSASVAKTCWGRCFGDVWKLN